MGGDRNYSPTWADSPLCETTKRCLADGMATAARGASTVHGQRQLWQLSKHFRIQCLISVELTVQCGPGCSKPSLGAGSGCCNLWTQAESVCSSLSRLGTSNAARCCSQILMAPARGCGSIGWRYPGGCSTHRLAATVATKASKCSSGANTGASSEAAEWRWWTTKGLCRCLGSGCEGL